MMVENGGPETFARRAILFEQKRPGMFYSCGFLLTWEVATLFRGTGRPAQARGGLSAFRPVADCRIERLYLLREILSSVTALRLAASEMLPDQRAGVAIWRIGDIVKIGGSP